MADIAIFHAPAKEGNDFPVLQTAHRECFEKFRARYPGVQISGVTLIQNCGEARCLVHNGVWGREAPYSPASSSSMSDSRSAAGGK